LSTNATNSAIVVAWCSGLRLITKQAKKADQEDLLGESGRSFR